jgi:hypothetical protein
MSGLIILAVVIVGLMALGALALAFGTDSRPRDSDGHESSTGIA